MHVLTRIVVTGIAAATLAMVVAGVGQAGGPPSLAWSPSTGGSFARAAGRVGRIRVVHDHGGQLQEPRPREVLLRDGQLRTDGICRA